MNFRLSYSLVAITFHSFLYVSAQESIEKQEVVSNHFLEIGLGLNCHGVRDLGTSPLTYKGYLPQIHLQYLFLNKRYSGILEENFSIGYLKTRNYPDPDDNRAVSYNNELAFDLLYSLKSSQKTSFYMGGQLGTLVDIRSNEKYNNANLNYEILATLSPTVLFEYRTSLKKGDLVSESLNQRKRDRDFKFQYILTVPVLTGILRPGYVTISDFVDDSGLVLTKDNITLSSFDHLVCFKNRFNFYYILHNNNMLKLNYNLSYFSYYGNYNPVRGFSSSFMVSVVFRFSNN
ncbi:MAG TPA: hypothetical protein VHO90_00280 [Bacteroidales bacterium]|nr:hypothetical protein [Bacteroidales bacterium]